MRIRTIRDAIKQLREEDGATCLTEWGLRGLVRDGKIPSTLIGTSRRLIDYDFLLHFLSNPQIEERPINEHRPPTMRIIR